MSLGTRIIDYDAGAPHVGNADAIACLAYPPTKTFWRGKSPKDWAEGQKLFSFALLWAWSTTKIRDDPSWGWQAGAPVPPNIFRVSDPEEVRRSLTHGMNALRSRYFAAEMGTRLLSKHEFERFGIGTALDGGHVSVNSLAGLIAEAKGTRSKSKSEDAQRSASGNVRQRDWVPTKPVLHLAIAFFDHMKGRLGTADVGEVVRLVEGDWLPNLLELAEHIRGVIADSPTFAGVSEGDLARISIR